MQVSSPLELQILYGQTLFKPLPVLCFKVKLCLKMIITCLHEQLGKNISPHVPTCGQLCMMSVLTPVKLSISGLLFQDFKIHHVYI